MAQFYLSDQLDDAQRGDLVVIGGEEARHAVTVSRIRVGETISIGNGRGLVVTGPVRDASAQRLTVEAAQVRQSERRRPRIVLVQALAKGDRDDLAVQAATELGVDEIVPWSAERSVSRWEGDKVAKGEERWRRIVREATKQSLRPWLPTVAPLVDLRALLGRKSGFGEARMLVLEPTAPVGLELAVVDAEHVDSVVLVVGPEGGISSRELGLLADGGATAVRLGPSVLRTSTAGPAAIAALSVLLGRWS